MPKSAQANFLDNVIPLKKFPEFEIRCQDNLKFMRKFEDDSFDLIVSSPPYNLGKEYENKKSQEI